MCKESWCVGFKQEGGCGVEKRGGKKLKKEGQAGLRSRSLKNGGDWNTLRKYDIYIYIYIYIYIKIMM